MVFNSAPAQLARWRAALANAALGRARAKIAFVGDSITMGSGAGSGGVYCQPGAYANSFPAQLSRMLTVAEGRDDTLFGSKAVPEGGVAGFMEYDPRVTFEGSGWAFENGGLGGHIFVNEGSGDRLIFAPHGAVDRCDIYYASSPGFGSFTVADDSGPLAIVDTHEPGHAFSRTTIERPSPGTSPFVLTRNSPGPLWISGFDCYDSARPAVQFYNFRVFGMQAVGMAFGTSPWNPLPALPVLAPHLSVIMLGSNDQGARRTIPEFSAAMQQIIDAAKQTGDVILVWCHPERDEHPSDPTADYRRATRALAVANDAPLVDLAELYVSYEVSKSLYHDTTHQNAAGAYVIARALLPLIQQ